MPLRVSLHPSEPSSRRRAPAGRPRSRPGYLSKTEQELERQRGKADALRVTLLLFVGKSTRRGSRVRRPCKLSRRRPRKTDERALESSKTRRGTLRATSLRPGGTRSGTSLEAGKARVPLDGGSKRALEQELERERARADIFARELSSLRRNSTRPGLRFRSSASRRCGERAKAGAREGAQAAARQSGRASEQ